MVSVPLTDTINMLLTDTTNAVCSSDTPFPPTTSLTQENRSLHHAVRLGGSCTSLTMGDIWGTHNRERCSTSASVRPRVSLCVEGWAVSVVEYLAAVGSGSWWLMTTATQPAMAAEAVDWCYYHGRARQRCQLQPMLGPGWRRGTPRWQG
jgi:hypothetical protein